MATIAPGRLALFVGIAGAGCAADLATKRWAFHWLGLPGQRDPWWIIDGIFGFQTSLNRGALFGLGQGQVWIFASLSILAALGILGWMIFGGAARDRWMTVALAGWMGGILGNLFDRLGLWAVPGREGTRIFAVRDWILFKYQDWVWPNFNIADSLLVCGAFLMAWHALRPQSIAAPADKPAAASEG